MSSKGVQSGGVLALVVGTALVVTLLLFAMVRDWEQDRLQSGFRSATTAYLALFESRLNFYLEELYTLQRFYHSAGDISRGQFQSFVHAVVVENPEIQALEWIPMVPGHSRDAYEAAVRSEGVEAYRIREQSADGRMTVAARRDVYYPIHYVAPRVGNELAMGYDVGSSPIRLAALQQARESGKPVATGRMSVLQADVGQHSFLVFLPVYHSNAVPASAAERNARFKGVVVGVFDIGATFEWAIAKLADQGIDLHIVDLRADRGEAVLYQYESSLGREDSHAIDDDAYENGYAKLSHVEHFDVAGRQWAMHFTSVPRYMAYHRQWQSVAVLAMGVMLTVGIAVFVVGNRRRTAVVAAMVEQRTVQLRDVETRQRAVLDTMADALITIDDKGIVESMNQAAERLFKYRAEEVVGHNVSRLMPEPYRHEHDEYISRYLTTNNARVIGIGREVRGCRKDGSVFYAELAVSEMKIGGHTFFSGILRDISDRKAAEEQLETSYMLQNMLNLLLNTSLKHLTFDEFLEQALEIILAMPLTASIPCGAIFLAEEGSGSLFMRAQRGFTPKERVAFRCIDLNSRYCGEVAKAGRAQYVGGVKNATGDDASEANSCKGYFCVPMVLKGKVLGVIIVFPDRDYVPNGEEEFLDVVGGSMAGIVDRMQAQEKLNQFKTTLDMTLDCVFMFSPDTMKFFYVNQGAMKQVGYSYDELMAMGPVDIKPEMDEQPFMNLIQPMLSGEQSAISFETVHQHKNGTRIPVEVFLQYIHPHGESPRFVAIVRDITERKKVDRMKDEFVATVSHELRTPLTSIRGSLGLLTGGAMGELPAQVAGLLDIAHKNSERLLLLINDLLDMNKLESGQMAFRFEPIDVKSFVEQAVSSNAAYGEQYGVNFTITQVPDNVRVSGDVDRLMQVMNNLLSNAAKFSPEGAVVEIGVCHKDGRVRFSVADCGPGIADEFRVKIFERFTQSDSSDTRKVGGTGLGLNISKSIVEKHGGQLDFYSRVGAGATFYFDVPAVDAPADTSSDVVNL